jgi:hypothetical protein
VPYPEAVVLGAPAACAARPSARVPRQTRPRFAANGAGVHSTNNLHRVYLKKPWSAAAGLTTAAAMNAATMLTVELLGRVAAAGVLKIEPGDASKIRLLHPTRLPA